MFKNITYKKKLIILLAGFVIFLFVAYSLSIKNTFELADQCEAYETQLDFVKDAPVKIAQLQKELDSKEQLLGRNLSETEFQEQLLQKISSHCSKNDLVIRELPQVHTYRQHEYEIETYTTVIEGSYVRLLKLLYAMEQEYRIGKVVSAKFISKKDFKTNRLRLTLSMYIQNIKKDNNE